MGLQCRVSFWIQRQKTIHRLALFTRECAESDHGNRTDCNVALLPIRRIDRHSRCSLHQEPPQRIRALVQTPHQLRTLVRHGLCDRIEWKIETGHACRRSVTLFEEVFSGARTVQLIQSRILSIQPRIVRLSLATRRDRLVPAICSKRNRGGWTEWGREIPAQLQPKTLF